MRKTIISILALALLFSFVASTAETTEPEEDTVTYRPWTYVGLGKLIPNILDVIGTESGAEIGNVTSDDTFFWAQVANLNEEDFAKYLTILEEGGYAVPWRQLGSYIYYVTPDGFKLTLVYTPEDSWLSLNIN